MTAVHEGGCLCGSIRFLAHGEPLRTLVCHCRFCQKVTGSTSYAESMFLVEAVEFSGPAMGRYDHTSEGSGKIVHVHFCQKCGSTITLTFERWPEYRAISRGAFDDPNWVSITSHIWTASAQTGVPLPAQIDCFQNARLSPEGTPEVPQRFEVPVLVRRC